MQVGDSGLPAVRGSNTVNVGRLLAGIVSKIFQTFTARIGLGRE